MHGLCFADGLIPWGRPTVLCIILWYMDVPGCPNLLCQSSVVVAVWISIFNSRIFVTYKPGGIECKVSRTIGPASVCFTICNVSTLFWVHVCTCSRLDLISWKLTKFRVAFGANIADWRWRMVPLGSTTAAGPWPVSIRFCPVMVVIVLDELVIAVKYLLCLSIECDVPLSKMHMLGSPSGVCMGEMLCASGDGGSFAYLSMSAGISKKFP